MKYKLTLVITLLVGIITAQTWHHYASMAPIWTFMVPMLLFCVLEMLINKKLAFMHYLFIFVFPVIYFNPIWGRSGYEGIIATYYVLFIIDILLTAWMKYIMTVAIENNAVK